MRIVVGFNDGPAYAIDVSGTSGEHIPCPIIHESTGACGAPLACVDCNVPVLVVGANDMHIVARCPKCGKKTAFHLLIEPLAKRTAS